VYVHETMQWVQVMSIDEIVIELMSWEENVLRRKRELERVQRKLHL
jgi:hypothetical protein